MEIKGIDNLSEEDILNSYNDIVEGGDLLSYSAFYCCVQAGMVPNGNGCVNSFLAWCTNYNHKVYCSPCK